MDRDDIAPQLTARETIAAGTYLVFDILLLLLAIGIPVLIANLFSPTFPRRWKAGNVLGLLLLLSVPALIVLLVWWV
ncbi:MAG: hypothetical protein JXA09_09640 [Anaerolineae bacterium]|nr:hypothetical protein [Anaerolineae bacterium]